MTGPESPDLSALVSARLCHDLISPMGAIGNGLELMQMSGGRTGAEVNLISESLDNALAKLKFFRVAFGPADPQARQSFEEAAQITDAAFQGRFTVTWQAEGKDMPRPMARMLYLAILCLEKSLPMGGELRIAAAEDAARMTSRAAAPRRPSCSGRMCGTAGPCPTCARTGCSSPCCAAHSTARRRHSTCASPKAARRSTSGRSSPSRREACAIALDLLPVTLCRQ
jgi:hypothetical protein